MFGILGPNGAGKTTSVESLAGLRKPDAGKISVLGLDPRTDGDKLRAVVGVQLQESELPDKLEVGEALDLYASFYPDPADPNSLLEALGLDELTTGLDPQARPETWALIEGIRDRGVTIVLVTHFMEEAEHLCDRVALIDSGRVVAIDTPAGLADAAVPEQVIRFRPAMPIDDELLHEVPGVSSVTRHGDQVVVTGTGDCSAPSSPCSHATTS